MVGYCWDAYYLQLALEYEASGCAGERRAASPNGWQVPQRWVIAWVGALCIISLGLGSLSQWLAS